MTAAPAESVVYVIGNADNRLVKIGTTTQRKLKRLGQIQTMSPSILTVLWTTPGGKPLEDALHARFRAERRQGEWFDFGDRDPVSEVKRAVVDLGASKRPPTPEEALWNAMDDYGSWLRDKANVEQRRKAVSTLASMAREAANVVESLAGDSAEDPEGLLPDAVGAFHLAYQRLWGTTYPNSVGPGSPRATVAMLSNMAWLAACTAGIIEDDSLVVYSPQQAAEFAHYAARTIGRLGEALNCLSDSMAKAFRRGDVPSSAARALGSIPELLDFAASDLAGAGRELRDTRYCGYVARGDDETAQALFDELSERELGPVKERTDAGAPMISFDYEQSIYRLAKVRHDWLLRTPADERHGAEGLELGFVDGAANHPAQMVNHALDMVDSILNTYTHSERRRDYCATMPRDSRGDIYRMPDDPNELQQLRMVDQFLDQMLDNVVDEHGESP
jgi:hypothetical protein